MDEETITFLEDAGLKMYVKIFLENKIGINEIRDIDTDTLRLLIPPIGDQVKYKKAINSNVLVERRVEPPSETQITALEPKTEALSAYQLQRANAFCISFDEPHSALPELNDLSVLLHQEDGDTENLFHLPEVQAAVKPPLKNTTEKPEESAQSPPRKRVQFKSVNSSSCSPAKSSKVETGATLGICSNKLNSKEELRAFLAACNDGQMVLNFFEVKEKLNEGARRKLTNVITQHLMVIHGKLLSNAHFKAVAEVIVELFPSECVQVYYIPPHTEGTDQTVSKGKLPYKHRNLKSCMEKRNVKIPGSSSTHATPNASTSENLLSEQQFLESQGWLKSYSEPWTEVLERWTKTAPNRVLQFTKRRDLSIRDILKDWPLFKHPLGYTLISTDFKVLFPEKGLELLNGWPSCRDKLVDIIRERSKKDKHSIGRQILSSLPSTISEDSKDVVAMYLLPTLLPPAIIREKGQKSWKPTIGEAQEAFALYAKDAASIKIAVDQKQKKYENQKRSIQPCVLIVGETIHTAQNFYVLFENVQYKMSSVLAVVDTCYKIMHIMNLAYPAEAFNTWMFIQRHFYQLVVPKEKVAPCVMGLISEL